MLMVEQNDNSCYTLGNSFTENCGQQRSSQLYGFKYLRLSASSRV